MKHKVKIISILLLLFHCVLSRAQDIIVKTDKTEVKARVLEIGEANIKYKKWDFQDGPTYNLSTKDVFMVIYANGQRELVGAAGSAPSPGKQEDKPAIADIQHELATKMTESNSTALDTTIDYKSIKIKYKPTRIVVGLQAPISAGTDAEVRIVKNILNLGLYYQYAVPSDELIVSQQFGYIYGSLYAPLNRLMGNYEKQDKGLFIFGHAGYGYTSTQAEDYNGKTYSYGAGGFTWRLGMDYIFTKSFGLTVSTFECKTAYAGVLFSF